MSAAILLLIPLALYFLMIRPQRQRVIAQRAMMTSLQPGDRVVTAGGMIGTIVTIDAERASVEMAPGVVLEFLTPAVTRRLDAGTADETGPADIVAPEDAAGDAPANPQTAGDGAIPRPEEH